VSLLLDFPGLALVVGCLVLGLGLAAGGPPWLTAGERLVIGLVLAVVAPALAQIQITIPGFRSDFPWFTNVPQAQTFEQFLANHPDEARELSQNPGLLYDPSWRAQHRQLQYFLQTHPDVWEGLKAQGADIYDARFR